jgi:hypothetical protein
MQNIQKKSCTKLDKFEKTQYYSKLELLDPERVKINIRSKMNLLILLCQDDIESLQIVEIQYAFEQLSSYLSMYCFLQFE